MSDVTYVLQVYEGPPVGAYPTFEAAVQAAYDHLCNSPRIDEEEGLEIVRFEIGAPAQAVDYPLPLGLIHYHPHNPIDSEADEYPTMRLYAHPHWGYAGPTAQP